MDSSSISVLLGQSTNCRAIDYANQQMDDHCSLFTSGRMHGGSFRRWRRTSIGTRAHICRSFEAGKILRGIDQKDVAKGLRKIAQMTSGMRIIFLGQQADVVA